jgi:hypothetical protein
MSVIGHPDELMAGALAREPGVQPDLDVHMVIGRPRLLDHVEGFPARCGGAQRPEF